MSSRAFPTTSDRLDTGVTGGKGSTNAFTAGAWVKLTTVETNQKAIFGGEESGSGNGFNFYIANADADSIQVRFRPGNGHGDSSSANFSCDPTVPFWVGCINSVADNNIRFYAGTTPDNIALVTTIATTRVLHSSIGGGNTINVGVIRLSNATYQETLKGWLDQVFLARDQEFTLQQLKEAAACGANSTIFSLCTFFYLIDGSSPEEDSSANNNDATVTGTSVEAAMCQNFAQPANASQIMAIM